MMQFMVYIWFYQVKVNISMRFILCKIKKSIKNVICFIISIYSTCKKQFCFQFIQGLIFLNLKNDLLYMYIFTIVHCQI